MKHIESVFRVAGLTTGHWLRSGSALHRYVYGIVQPDSTYLKSKYNRRLNPRILKTLAMCEAPEYYVRVGCEVGRRSGSARARPSADGEETRAAARGVSSGAPLPRRARVVRADHLRLRHAAALLLRKREPICPHADNTVQYKHINVGGEDLYVLWKVELKIANWRKPE